MEFRLRVFILKKIPLLPYIEMPLLLPFIKGVAGWRAAGFFSPPASPSRAPPFWKEEIKARARGGFSLVDFNRAGVPLMELVTEPVISSAREAADFARELQLLLRYLGTSGA